MKMFKVSRVDNMYTFTIELPEGWKEKNVPALVRDGGNESVGGYVQTTRQPIFLKFKSLAEAVAEPEFLGVIDDDPKLFAEPALHSIFRAIHQVAENIHSDNVTNAVDDVIKAAKQIDNDIDETLVKNIALAFHGNLNPMATFVGGVAAQEVLKLASGKYNPIKQWFYYDTRELIELRSESVTASEFAPRNSRYDGQIAVLGNTIQQKILDANAFIVGAGALGCEHIKNIAMMGLGCNGKGATVSITDMDSIELSNLSRQFLFRQHHVAARRTKSSVAAEVACEMNSHLNIDAKELKVGTDTENIFNETFWSNQTVILNALDNVPTRLYVDEQCVHYQKPLFESGTNGPKANTQSVIPFLTENYGATRDPPEKEYAICTLKNFPNAIEHTIHWAKEAFGTEFTAIPTEVNSFIHSNAAWKAAVARDPSAKSGSFVQIVEAVNNAPKNWADCVAWARLKFEEYFSNTIKHLMHNLPIGAVKDGKQVWGGAKRPPVAAVFDVENELHFEFLISAACLHANVYGLPLPDAATLQQIDEIKKILTTVKIPEWKPKEEQINVDSEKEKQQQQDAAAAAAASANITEKDLPDPSTLKNLKLNIQEFEKDDDSNFHVDFMNAVSNLRATNYNIPVVTRDRTKFIAGKIIPAMITTTASATGLVGLELLKYFMGANKISHYRNAYLNLAVPLFTLTWPTAAAKAKSYTTSQGKEISFTLWDRIDIGDGSRDMTVQEVVDVLKEKYDIDTDMISTANAKVVYMGAFTKKDKLSMTITQVLAQLGYPVKEDEETVTLVATGCSNDVDVEIPAIQYRFKGTSTRVRAD